MGQFVKYGLLGGLRIQRFTFVLAHSVGWLLAC